MIKRLFERLRFAMPDFIYECLDELAAKIVATRNYYIHNSGQYSKSDILDRDSMVAITILMKFMIRVRLLLEVGVSEDDIKNILYLRKPNDASHLIGNFLIDDLELREMIIKGECPMGSRLLENDFAAAMDVSRASIREAFAILESEGLLIKNRNKYTMVLTFTPEDVENIYLLRSAIEVSCLKASVKRGLIDIDALHELSSAISDAYKSSESNQSVGWTRADMDFHDQLVLQSGNIYAYNVWRTLQYRILTLLNTAMMRTSKYPTLLTDKYSHDNIITCVKEHNMDGAVRFLEAHIMSGCELILDNLK